MRRPILIIDGGSFAHRAALPKSIRHHRDKGAAAIPGFANFLLRYGSECPRAVIVGWDTLKKPTYRHDGKRPSSALFQIRTFCFILRLPIAGNYSCVFRIEPAIVPCTPTSDFAQDVPIPNYFLSRSGAAEMATSDPLNS